jgi:hypothetical protein
MYKLNFNLSSKRWVEERKHPRRTSKVAEVVRPCWAHWHDLTKLLKLEPAIGVNKPWVHEGTQQVLPD